MSVAMRVAMRPFDRLRANGSGRAPCSVDDAATVTATVNAAALASASAAARTRTRATPTPVPAEPVEAPRP